MSLLLSREVLLRSFSHFLFAHSDQRAVCAQGHCPCAATFNESLANGFARGPELSLNFQLNALELLKRSVGMTSTVEGYPLTGAALATTAINVPNNKLLAPGSAWMLSGTLLSVGGGVPSLLLAYAWTTVPNGECRSLGLELPEVVPKSTLITAGCAATACTPRNLVPRNRCAFLPFG